MVSCRILSLSRVGRLDENGNFVFEHGFGQGVDGFPYDASIPQGTGKQPFWSRHVMTRRFTMLYYMERRAFQSTKPQPGSYAERLRRVTARLAERWEKNWARNEARPCDDRQRRYHQWLVVTKNFPDWLARVVSDYFVEQPNEAYDHCGARFATTSSANFLPCGWRWDIGQTAYRNGAHDNKILVRQLLKDVDRVGRERFPGPLRWP